MRAAIITRSSMVVSGLTPSPECVLTLKVNSWILGTSVAAAVGALLGRAGSMGLLDSIDVQGPKNKGKQKCYARSWYHLRWSNHSAPRARRISKAVCPSGRICESLTIFRFLSCRGWNLHDPMMFAVGIHIYPMPSNFQTFY